MTPLLEVDRLEVSLGRTPLLRQLSFTLQAGERLGIVGESGAGKSMLAHAVMNLLPPPAHISSGALRFMQQDLRTLDPAALHRLRGRQMAMIFQDPMMTLNPLLTIGTQLTECLTHPPAGVERISARAARVRAIEALQEVRIPAAASQLQAYPHQLSGGMRQRVAIAIALLHRPALLIADEPTTALDVTIQAEILALLTELCTAQRMALMLITHDLGVLAETTDHTLVLYAGEAVETAPTRALIERPRHPYSRALLDALPQRATPGQPLRALGGSMPTASALPSGCAFHPRCPQRMSVCPQQPPQWQGTAPDRQRRCHLPIEVDG